MNLVQIGKTLTTLMSQVQEYIFDYILHRSLTTETPEEKDPTLSNIGGNVGWNFPGLKAKRGAAAKNQQDQKQQQQQQSYASKEANKMNEILLLQQRSVLQIVDRLKLCAHRCQYTPQQPLAEMKRILNALDKAFNRLVDMFLAREMKFLINELAAPASEITLRSALNTIILLGNEGSNHLCTLLSREGGVRNLLRHCHLIYGQTSSSTSGRFDPAAGPGSPLVSFPADEIRILSLRGLSSICCVAECIREFEQVRLKPKS